MAESLAVLGIIANVGQIISLAIEVIDRVNDFSSSDSPKLFRDLKIELPLFSETLRRTQERAQSGELTLDEEAIVIAVVDSCHAQLKVLNELVKKTLPTPGDSSFSKKRKAVKSFFKYDQATQIVGTLRGYMSTLTGFQVVSHTLPIHQAPKVVKGIFTNPVRQVSDFVQRPALRVAIENGFLVDRTVMLKGMGGQGKTQLALEYCRFSRESRLYESIFWIDASSISTLKSSFQLLSTRITLPPSKFTEVDEAVAFVLRTLDDASYPWLMVFDNYDDPTATGDIRDYMTQRSGSHFLVTSRHSDSMRLGEAVDVGGMTETEAIDLLLERIKVTKHESNINDAKEIVTKLGYHPLAIDQTGAYILSRRLPLGQFLGIFEEQKARILKTVPKAFWEYRRKLNGEEMETSLSVFASWELSFQHLNVETIIGRRKAQLITLFAFLNNQNISDRPFHARHKLSCQTEMPDYLQLLVDHNNKWDNYALQELFVEFRDLSLIMHFAESDQGHIYVSFHPLVKDWIKLRIDIETERKTLQELTLSVGCLLRLHEETVDDFNMTLSLKIETLAYVRACQEEIVRFNKSACTSNTCATLCLGEGTLAESGGNFANFYLHMVSIDSAFELLSTTIAWHEAGWEEPNPQLEYCYDILALVLRWQADYEGAVVLHRKAVEGRKRKQGAKSQETLLALSRFTTGLTYIQEYTEAVEVQEVVVCDMVNTLGVSNRHTVRAMYRLAHSFYWQGEKLKATKTLQEAHHLGSQLHRSGSPENYRHDLDVVNLSTVCAERGDLEDAINLAREFLLSCVSEWGSDSVQCCSRLMDLATSLALNFQWREAEDVLKSSVETSSGFRDKSIHLKLLSRLSTIIRVHQDHSGVESSRDIRQPLEVGWTTFKSLTIDIDQQWKTPAMLEALSDLAESLATEDMKEESLEVSLCALRSSQKHLGLLHDTSFSTLECVLDNLCKETQQDRRTEICKPFITALKEEIGRSEVASAGSVNAVIRLLAIYDKLGDENSFSVVYDQRLEAILLAISSGPSILARSRSHVMLLGVKHLLHARKEFKRAELFSKRMLEISESKAKGSPVIGYISGDLGDTLSCQLKYQESIPHFRQAVESFTEHSGKINIDTLRPKLGLAYVLSQTMNEKEAEVLLREAIPALEKLGSLYASDWRDALDQLQQSLRNQEKWNEGEEIIRKLIALRRLPFHKDAKASATLLWDLGAAIACQGKYKDALDVYNEACKEHREHWGIDAEETKGVIAEMERYRESLEQAQSKVGENVNSSGPKEASVGSGDGENVNSSHPNTDSAGGRDESEMEDVSYSDKRSAEHDTAA